MTTRPSNTPGLALVAFLALLLATAALGQEAIISARIVGTLKYDDVFNVNVRGSISSFSRCSPS
jgi:hypothetical protein